MRLEQTLERYQPMQMQRTQERERVYTFMNLESLSASALYSGDLTIRPISPNVSLNLHEGAGGTAHLKIKGKEYQNLSSYEAAMLDPQMDRAGLPKIYTTDKCDRTGRK
jgi:hypothetical protein